MANNSLPLIDIGANLLDKKLYQNIDSIIQKSRSNNVEKIIITSSHINDTKEAIKLIHKEPNIFYTTVGFHPHNAKEYSQELFSEIKSLLQYKEVKSIGETGLDFYRNFSSPKDQQISFEAHLELSIEKNIPLFLHERDAHERFTEITSSYIEDLPKSVVHCFTGNKKSLQKYIDMGFYIGITGWLCDERRGKHLEELIPLIPLDKLMIETDAPYLLPRDMGLDNSTRNEPKYLKHIAKKVSGLRKESEELILSAIYMNSIDFFNISV